LEPKFEDAFANSFDPDETPQNMASHQDPTVFRRKKRVIRLANAGGLAGWLAGWRAGGLAE
ncbi:hypothetical protein DPMN_172390, partial [Dreissena polymorpha]